MAHRFAILFASNFVFVAVKFFPTSSDPRDSPKKKQRMRSKKETRKKVEMVKIFNNNGINRQME